MTAGHRARMHPVAAVALVVRARRVVLPDGERPASVLVGGGRIVAVEGYEVGPGNLAADVVEVDDDAVLLPGLVDTHVHVNEPGRTDWEGFASATRAAAAGGITTVVDMPLNSQPPTVDPAALAAKRSAAAGQVHVDVGLWGGAVPGNEAALPALHEAGVVGFKCFLADSGVPEFPPLDRAGLDRALHVLAPMDALLAVHAEDPNVLAGARAPAGRSYDAFLASRPPEAETAAIDRLIAAARAVNARVHVVHVSAAAALPLLAAARRDGVRVTAETCPHYLALAAEEVPAGDTRYKCCPPIRDAANREALWAGLADGTIDCVVSDHSPCPAALKRLDAGDFGAAWGGIASLQVALPMVWTEARRRGFALADVVRWMAHNPAALAGLAGKGRIAPGHDADLVAFAPVEEFTVDPAGLHHRHPVTPYAGRRLAGVVRSTWLRGRRVADQPRGRLLARTNA
jgi:allantoinase